MRSQLFLAACLLPLVASNLAEMPQAADAEDPSQQTAFGQALDLRIESASRIELDGYYPLYSIDVTADGEGRVHLFASPGFHQQKDGRAPAMIEHFVLSDKGATLLQGVKAAERPIRSIEATASADGHLYLLWVEEPDYYPNAHASRIYVSEWNPKGWSSPQRVSDPKARPSIHYRGRMTLAISPLDSIDVFWIDSREVHFWRSLITFGEGDFPKVFHRRQTRGQFESVTRVGKRGAFMMMSLAALYDRGDALHLFWTQSRRRESRTGYTSVFHSMFIDGRWVRPETLSDLRNYDGTPSTSANIVVASGPGGSVLVAWIWARWVSESEKEHVLQCRSYRDGHWSEGTVTLSRRARHVAWSSGPGGITGLFVQEYPFGYDSYADPVGHKLFFIPIRELNAESKNLVASNTVADLFDATVTPDGVTHVVYVNVNASEETTMQYRRATLQPAIAMGAADGR